jgi:hypothetical protein
MWGCWLGSADLRQFRVPGSVDSSGFRKDEQISQLRSGTHSSRRVVESNVSSSVVWLNVSRWRGREPFYCSQLDTSFCLSLKRSQKRVAYTHDNNTALINLRPLFVLPISNTIGALPYNFNLCALFSNNLSYDLRLFQHICYSNSSILSESHSPTPFLALLFKLVWCCTDTSL